MKSKHNEYEQAIKSAHKILIVRRNNLDDWTDMGTTKARTIRGLLAAMRRARIDAQPDVRAHIDCGAGEVYEVAL